MIVEIDWSYEEKKRSVALMIILISFFCSLPFLSFIIRADWEKPNSIEILRQENPKGYDQYMVDLKNENAMSTPDMDYFVKPIHYISAILGFPFIISIAIIIYSIQFIISIWMMLPKIAKFILSLLFKIMFLIISGAIAIEIYDRIANLFRRK